MSTKNTKKSTSKLTISKRTTTQLADAVGAAIYKPTTGDDIKTAILVVSVLINLTILILWLVLQATTQYDSQVAATLLQR